jgi:hypothetical protein
VAQKCVSVMLCQASVGPPLRKPEFAVLATRWSNSHCLTRKIFFQRHNRTAFPIVVLHGIAMEVCNFPDSRPWLSLASWPEAFSANPFHIAYKTSIIFASSNTVGSPPCRFGWVVTQGLRILGCPLGQRVGSYSPLPFSFVQSRPSVLPPYLR